MNTPAAASVAALAGLIVVMLGAIVAARGVLVTEQDAADLAGTYWDENKRLKASLLRQSTLAWRGLALVAVGTILQLPAAALPLLSL